MSKRKRKLITETDVEETYTPQELKDNMKTNFRKVHKGLELYLRSNKVSYTDLGIFWTIFEHGLIHSQSNGWFSMSYEQIQEITYLSKPTVIAGVERLSEEYGLIRKKTVEAKGYPTGKNFYCINHYIEEQYNFNTKMKIPSRSKDMLRSKEI